MNHTGPTIDAAFEAAHAELLGHGFEWSDSRSCYVRDDDTADTYLVGDNDVEIRLNVINLGTWYV